MFPRQNIMIYIWPLEKIALIWPQELHMLSFYSSFTCNFCHTLHPASYSWKDLLIGSYGSVLRRALGTTFPARYIPASEFLVLHFSVSTLQTRVCLLFACIQEGSPVCCLARPVQEGNTSVPRCNCIKGEHHLSSALCTGCSGCPCTSLPHLQGCVSHGKAKYWPRQSKTELKCHTQASVAPIFWLSTCPGVLMFWACPCFRHPLHKY